MEIELTLISPNGQVVIPAGSGVHTVVIQTTAAEPDANGRIATVRSVRFDFAEAPAPP